ncbi:MAG: hypothetical protein R3A12_03935 [Ignavibacteria bacterium]
MILITGASRGIGKFLFEKFTGMNSNDEKVIGTYLNDNEELSGNDEFFKVDITKYDELEKLSEILRPKLKISSSLTAREIITTALRINLHRQNGAR